MKRGQAMLLAEAGVDLFSDASKTARSLYLLADTAARPDLSYTAALRWPDSAIDLLTLAAPQWSQNASPVLLEAPATPFAALQIDRWRRFADEMRYANALTIIESEMSLKALSQALARRLRVQLADGATMLLRLFDNRTLTDLLAILDAEQMDLMLAPATAWHFAGRDGTSRVARNPGNFDAARAAGSYCLQLTQAQEDKLLQLSEPDNITGMLLQQGNGELLSMLPHEQHAVVAAHLSAADRWDIEGTPDRAAFVALGLQLGEGFDQQEPWAERLTAARASRRPFRDALADALEQL